MYSVFSLLSAGRQYNEAGPQPLSLVDIIAMMTELGIDGVDERLEYHRYLRVLDTKLIELAHEKMKVERDRLLSKSR